MRRILHHGSTPFGTPVLLADRAVAGCWFELHRQGGCGSGEVVLKDAFVDRDAVSVGDWISFERTPGERWYLGRVEERLSRSPAVTRLRLEGMSVELNELFPGGFGEAADGRKPHRLAATDLFSNDPDRSEESADLVTTVTEAVELLLQRYAVPGSHIAYVPELVESPASPATVTSLKFRGEESLRNVLKDLAVRAGGASWGVNADGEFYFLQRRTAPSVTLREGQHLVRLEESQTRELLFNRILLTGDYVYDMQDLSGDIARRNFRWRGNYVQPASRAAYGDRRLRLWLPWIRTQADSVAFVREFFRTYSQPQSRYLLETGPMTSFPCPWFDTLRLENRDGVTLCVVQPESVRVQFDHVPTLRLELGPIDPRELWPEPPQDERWEVGVRAIGGGDVVVTDHFSESSGDSSGGGDDSSGGGGSSSPGGTSSVIATSEVTSSDDSQETSLPDSSGATSFDSSNVTSEVVTSAESSDFVSSDLSSGFSEDDSSTETSEATSEETFGESSSDGLTSSEDLFSTGDSESDDLSSEDSPGGSQDDSDFSGTDSGGSTDESSTSGIPGGDSTVTEWTTEMSSGTSWIESSEVWSYNGLTTDFTSETSS